MDNENYPRIGLIYEKSILKNQSFDLRIRSNAKNIISIYIRNDKRLSDCNNKDIDSTIWVNKEIINGLETGLNNNNKTSKELQVIARRIEYIY